MQESERMDAGCRDPKRWFEGSEQVGAWVPSDVCMGPDGWTLKFKWFTGTAGESVLPNEEIHGSKRVDIGVHGTDECMEPYGWTHEFQRVAAGVQMGGRWEPN